MLSKRFLLLLLDPGGLCLWEAVLGPGEVWESDSMAGDFGLCHQPDA